MCAFPAQNAHESKRVRPMSANRPIGTTDVPSGRQINGKLKRRAERLLLHLIIIILFYYYYYYYYIFVLQSVLRCMSENRTTNYTRLFPLTVACAQTKHCTGRVTLRCCMCAHSAVTRCYYYYYYYYYCYRRERREIGRPSRIA
jgi:hypothetical protein